MSKINQRGVLLVDINGGSFVVAERDGGLLTSIVDFEMAVELKKMSLVDANNIFNWYSATDLGLEIAENVLEKDSDTFKKAEIHRWARTLLEVILGPIEIKEQVVLSSRIADLFKSVKDVVEPILKEKIIKEARRNYQESQNSQQKGFFLGSRSYDSEDSFIQEQLDRELSSAIEDSLIEITLSEKLQKKGIIMSQKCLTFLSKALSLDLDIRPSDFSSLLE